LNAALNSGFNNGWGNNPNYFYGQNFGKKPKKMNPKQIARMLANGNF
jgi:hypothetical protein